MFHADKAEIGIHGDLRHVAGHCVGGVGSAKTGFLVELPRFRPVPPGRDRFDPACGHLPGDVGEGDPAIASCNACLVSSQFDLAGFAAEEVGCDGIEALAQSSNGVENRSSRSM